MSVPINCEHCKIDKINSNLLDGEIGFPLEPIRGVNPFVMLIGQDPTSAKGKVSSVLDLDNEKGILFKYIVNEILKPAGLSFDNGYATNLIKCRFPNNQTPKRIAGKNII